jgi:hypothetical protein
VERERANRELRRVVKRILPLVPTGRNIAKAEFEAVHAEILACVHEKTGASPERLGQLKSIPASAINRFPLAVRGVNDGVRRLDVVRDDAVRAAAPP